ncbi:TonB-dependent siderophore receptor [Candidatus Pantoea formicae]|uniref:TonB-dependent siderophore receptor n=1 Tax=Candidatus Pantoea formicae TaxID=2608355 RepID=UPI003ED88778
MQNNNKNRARWSTPLTSLALLVQAHCVIAEETLTVNANGESSSEKGYVAQTSSTASRTNQSILATPQSVSVITRGELNDRNVQSTTQALQYTPGVFASTTAISSRFDYFSIRGFDATLNGTLLDGLRSTTRQSYVRYEPYGLEQLDVLRGPNGFLYGAGSPGGTVNGVSKRPTLTAQHEVALQTGSHGRMQGQFDTSGPLDDDKTLLYRVVGVARDSNTQFNNVPDDTLYLAPSLTWRPDTDTTLTVLASVNRNKFGPPRPFLPLHGTLLSNPNGPVNRNSYLDGTNLDNHMTQTNLGYELDHKFADRWTFHSASRYSETDLTTQTLSGSALAADMRTLSRVAYAFRIKGKIFATDNNLKTQWEAGPVQGSSVAGLSFRHTGEDYTLNYGRASSIDIYNPTGNGRFSAPTAYTSTQQNANETGVYLSNSLSLFQHLNLDLSARQDWATVNTKNRLSDSYTSQNDQRFTWRAGLSWITDSGVAPYVSYATSFAPTLSTNIYGENYKPTTGKQWEVGVKYQPVMMDALFTLAWFDLQQNNVLTTDPNNSLNSVQTGQITSKGIEASATANLTDQWKLVASYSWNDLETTQSSVAGAQGKTPVAMPEHMASLWSHYTVQSGPLASLGLGAGIRYSGSTWADTNNTIKVPDYTLVDASIHYDLGQLSQQLHGVNVALNANNLFNKHYWVSCSTTTCNTGYDRSLLATLSYRW